MILLLLALLSVNVFAQQHYGMIINGGGDETSNHIRYQRNNENFFKSITGCGIKRDNVIVLNADGLSKGKDLTVTDSKVVNPKNISNLIDGKELEDLTVDSPTSLMGDNKVDVDGPATAGEIETQSSRLSKKMKAGDHLTVYVNDHGTQITEESYDPNTGKKTYKKVPGIVLWGESMSVTKFKQIMRKFSDKGVQTQIVSSACYSGGLLELTDKNTCVFTTTTDKKVTHSNTYNNEYMDAFSKKLGECKPMVSAHSYGKTLDSNGNEPQTSLDWYFKTYLKNKYEKNKDVVHCEPVRKDSFEKINSLNVASTTFVKPVRDIEVIEFNKRMEKLEKEEKEAKKQIPARIEELKAQKAKIEAELRAEKATGKISYYDKADVKNIDRKIEVLSGKKESYLSAKDKMLFSKADTYDLNMYSGLTSCMEHTPGQND